MNPVLSTAMWIWAIPVIPGFFVLATSSGARKDLCAIKRPDRFSLVQDDKTFLMLISFLILIWPIPLGIVVASAFRSKAHPSDSLKEMLRKEKEKVDQDIERENKQAEAKERLKDAFKK